MDTGRSASPVDPLDALGDATRRAIVELLGGGARSVGQLAAALPISRPAVSRHLRLLKEAGLVVEEPRGTRRIYRLHDEGIDEGRRYLERVWGEAAVRPHVSRIGLRARLWLPGLLWAQYYSLIVAADPKNIPPLLICSFVYF